MALSEYRSLTLPTPRDNYADKDTDTASVKHSVNQVVSQGAPVMSDQPDRKVFDGEKWVPLSEFLKKPSSDPQGSILKILAKLSDKPRTVVELVNETGLSKSMVYQRLRKLEKDGFAVRKGFKNAVWAITENAKGFSSLTKGHKLLKLKADSWSYPSLRSRIISLLVQGPRGFGYLKGKTKVRSKLLETTLGVMKKEGTVEQFVKNGEVHYRLDKTTKVIEMNLGTFDYEPLLLKSLLQNGKMPLKQMVKETGWYEEAVRNWLENSDLVRVAGKGKTELYELTEKGANEASGLKTKEELDKL